LPVGELFRPDSTVNRETTGPRPTTEGLGTNFDESPCVIAGFVENSDPTPGNVPRFKCVWGPTWLTVFMKSELGDLRDFVERLFLLHSEEE
jgi:hypothetical protein